ncbi:MAG: hypothetical protein HC779_08660, partial [Phyllobacteriaceae bacterium]|nr:hypothetical protein [Phyllobacteriaceae bacterium]
FQLSGRAADADESGVPSVRLRAVASPRGGLYSADLDGRITADEGTLEWAGDAGFTLLAPGSGPDAMSTLPLARVTGQFVANPDGLALNEAVLSAGSPDLPYTAEGSARLEFGDAPLFSISLQGQQLRLGEAGASAKTDRLEGEVAFAERLTGLQAFLKQLPMPTIPGKVDIALPALVLGDTTARNVVIVARPEQANWQIDAFSAELPGRTIVEGNGVLARGDAFGFRATSPLPAASQPGWPHGWG